jgi:hypothetical protein
MDEVSNKLVWAEKLATLIREEGYRAKVDSDGVIEGSAGGYRIIIICYPTTNFQIYCGFNGDGLLIDEKDINALNARYRFGKFFLDEDRDLTLTMDVFIDVDEPGAIGVVRSTFIFFENNLSRLIEAMDTARSPVAATHNET